MFMVNVPPATGVSATVVDGATVVETPVPLLPSGELSSSSPQPATKTEIAKNTPATRAARITDPPVKFSIAQRATLGQATSCAGHECVLVMNRVVADLLVRLGGRRIDDRADPTNCRHRKSTPVGVLVHGLFVVGDIHAEQLVIGDK